LKDLSLPFVLPSDAGSGKSFPLDVVNQLPVQDHLSVQNASKKKRECVGLKIAQLKTEPLTRVLAQMAELTGLQMVLRGH
jgi:hypothetical protein